MHVRAHARRREHVGKIAARFQHLHAREIALRVEHVKAHLTADADLIRLRLRALDDRLCGYAQYRYRVAHAARQRRVALHHRLCSDVRRQLIEHEFLFLNWFVHMIAPFFPKKSFLIAAQALPLPVHPNLCAASASHAYAYTALFSPFSF